MRVLPDTLETMAFMGLLGCWRSSAGRKEAADVLERAFAAGGGRGAGPAQAA